MPGYFKALGQEGQPKAAINPTTQDLHFPDTFKPTMHETFSNESIYADKNTPQWEGPALREESGELKALELPNKEVLLRLKR